MAKLHEHLTAEQAGTIAKKAGAKHLFLAHLSQRYDGAEDQILKECRKEFKKAIVCDDLMRVEI